MIPLPVTNLVVDLVVAGTAEAHKVFSGVCTTLGNGDFVMHLRCGDDFSILLALFTQRVLADVSVTDAFPGTAILLVDVRGAFILVVLFAGNSGMLLTVLTIRQLGTAGVRTRTFWSPWHGFTSYGIVRPACT